jgi:hypothetical protein
LGRNSRDAPVAADILPWTKLPFTTLLKIFGWLCTAMSTT